MIRSYCILTQPYRRRMSTAAANPAKQDAVNNVILERHGGVGVITLNRVKQLNSLDLPMIRKIYPQLKKWVNDSTVTAVIIKGAGGKAFCAGGDVRAVYEAGSEVKKGKNDNTLTKDFFREEYVLNNAIGTATAPYIAFMDGITMGGGVGLSVHGHFRVATPKTLFAMPETHIGLFPDVGGGYFLPRMRNNLGMFLALTGYRLKGVDVRHAGIATHFVNSEQLETIEEEIKKVPSRDPLLIKAILDSHHNEAFDVESEFSLGPYIELIDTAFGQDSVEKIVEVLRSSDSEWAAKQLELLLKGSPTSVKVAFSQIRSGASLSLARVLKMEYRLSQRFMADNDFYEGVRSLLIERNQSAKWEPDSLEKVTEQQIQRYFSHLPEHRELRLKEMDVINK